MVSGSRPRTQAGDYLPFSVAGGIVNNTFMLLQSSRKEQTQKINKLNKSRETKCKRMKSKQMKGMYRR